MLGKLFQKKEQSNAERSVKCPVLKCFAYWLFAFACWEVLVHFTVFRQFHPRFLYAAGFTGAVACVITLLVSLVPAKARFAVTLVLTLGLVFVYGSQMVYEFIFGTLYSVAQMEIGGAALTSFWRETLVTIWEKLPYLVVLLVPVVALVLLRKFQGGMFRCRYGNTRVILLLTAAVLHMGSLLLLHFGEQGMFSDYYYYYSNTISTNQTAERFGVLTTFRLEMLGSYGGHVEETGYYVGDEALQEQPGQADDAEETAEEAAEPVYNVLELDFDALNSKTEDEVIQSINDYCSKITGTKQNEYTGMLSDYNLIVLCAESFSTGAIYPELMPTLHRLSTEGIIFNNYYNSFPNTTTDGEYALMQGLWPDGNREKSASSLYASRNSYLPFTLGNLFMEQRGIQSYGYHNYEGDYYGRNLSHPNMGYSMKFARDGMKFTSSWPASDLEMMEQSVDDYIGMEQFHAYYMTFSGHYKYDTSNELVVKNWKEAINLPFSRKARSYISCNLELEYALAYLMERLEEAGVADKTAIVLAGDHFPYGLEDKEYSELVGYDIDDFSRYKSTLIFWVGGLEEKIEVNEYCCNVDILPTILNLWGFDYDSRMLAGTDVFSDSTHAAVLIDKSFLTDKVWFNTNTGEIRYLVDESEIPEGYIENMHRMINNRFTISSDILGKAYYNFVFDKGEVKVPKDAWKR